ncbi:c-type cytochrome [Pseudobacteriovorax antillogorgiicola]|nr:cytochrome c [Pseudobacteriovorax antillogorgiicola]
MSWVAQAADFSIQSEGGGQGYSYQDLWQHPKAETVSLPLLNYPGQELSVRVVPARELLKSLAIKDQDRLKFHCLDGYSGFLDPKLLLSQDPSRSEAYLAIEDPDNPWPPLPKKNNKDKVTAGPYYLVWKEPKKSNIPPEFWPYQLKGLELIKGSALPFAKLNPAHGLEAGSPIMQGFQVYQKRCMQCHTLNGEGPSTMGPDLNLPMNPTEYFKPAALRKFIKNPASVREWSDMKMRWVAENTWSDQDIEVLVAYLEHMASRKLTN